MSTLTEAYAGYLAGARALDATSRTKVTQAAPASQRRIRNRDLVRSAPALLRGRSRYPRRLFAHSPCGQRGYRQGYPRISTPKQNFPNGSLPSKLRDQRFRLAVQSHPRSFRRRKNGECWQPYACATQRSPDSRRRLQATCRVPEALPVTLALTRIRPVLIPAPWLILLC